MSRRSTPSPDYNKGHRRRMRELFLKNPDALENYQILEMCLYGALQRSDTRTLAKSILEKFDNSLFNVLNADADTLMELCGLSENIITHILLMRQVVTRFNSHKLKKSTKLGNMDSVVEYLKKEIGSLDYEVSIALYLDNGLRLKYYDKYKGANSNVSLDKNKIIQAMLNNKAASVIISHNHPSGDVSPSKEDLHVTKDIANAVASIDNIELIDHVIVSHHRHFSFLENGLLDKSGRCIEEKFSQYAWKNNLI